MIRYLKLALRFAILAARAIPEPLQESRAAVFINYFIEGSRALVNDQEFPNAPRELSDAPATTGRAKSRTATKRSAKARTATKRSRRTR
jgi:hypothetical protein